MMTTNSAKFFERAQTITPGGVNSPVRAFASVGGTPPFLERGQGCRIHDVDGNTYIDYVGSWGPLILGHCHPEVRQAIHEAVDRGTSFGAPTKLEIDLAELVHEIFPAMEQIRMVNSGTEATMSALRVARGFTGRDKIVKFAGCYHGHADSLLVEAGSGALSFGHPNSAGVPQDFARHTLIAQYNHIDSVSALFQAFPEQIAAVIIEPVAGNMGTVLPTKTFLQELRELCSKTGTLLIFDEVMTGFRVALGGAQSLFGIDPDLTCLGKIIGGGLPVGAYGGKREIMQKVAPLGPVYQAGTLSGNPLAMAAGLATLRILHSQQATIYPQLAARTEQLCEGFSKAFARYDMPICINRIASMFTIFFTREHVVDYEIAKTSDSQAFAHYFHGMLRQGIYLPASQFEANFVSFAHQDNDIRTTISALENYLAKL